MSFTFVVYTASISGPTRETQPMLLLYGQCYDGRFGLLPDEGSLRSESPFDFFIFTCGYSFSALGRQDGEYSFFSLDARAVVVTSLCLMSFLPRSLTFSFLDCVVHFLYSKRLTAAHLEAWPVPFPPLHMPLVLICPPKAFSAVGVFTRTFIPYFCFLLSPPFAVLSDFSSFSQYPRFVTSHLEKTPLSNPG